MEIVLPSDCGNAPRIGIVGDFVASWAKGDAEAIAEWLADNATWTVIGEQAQVGAEAARKISPPFRPERLEIFAIITHGRLASCDGYLVAGERRLDFAHSLRFAGAVKTSKIAEVRSYGIESSLTDQ